MWKVSEPPDHQLTSPCVDDKGPNLVSGAFLHAAPTSGMPLDKKLEVLWVL
jgi:hypothetical protein